MELRIKALEEKQKEIETQIREVNGSKISRLEARVHSLDVELEKEGKRRICDIDYLTNRINKLEADPNEE